GAVEWRCPTAGLGAGSSECASVREPGVRRARLATVGALAVASAGCGGGGTVTGRPLTVHSSLPVPAPLKIHLSSPAFANGSRIPTRYTCSGENVSPPLRWTGLPTGTKAIAVMMVD